MAVRIQFRRDDAATWVSVNPLLAEGEVGLETDTGMLKIGNGVDNWIDLPYNPIPALHAASHELGGTDEIAIDPTQVTGTAVIDSDSRLTDARTPTAHTHPLSNLTQSGATTGQAAVWDGTAWVPGTVASTPSRITQGSSFGTVADGATQTATFTSTGYKSAQIIEISTTVAGRVRLYGTAADRDADLSRPIGQEPTENAGCFLDVVTSASSLTKTLSPQVHWSNLDTPTVTTLYASFTNLSGASAGCMYTLHLIKTEA